MIEVHPGLFIAGDHACRPGTGELAVLHACKDPCHRRVVGYQERSLSASHPNYLQWGTDVDLYLNLVDPPTPLFKIESFVIALQFLRRNTQSGRKTLVHCNQGESRAPSIALLHLAKNLKLIASETYASAASAFCELNPRYRPGLGIKTFLSSRWAEL